MQQPSTLDRRNFIRLSGLTGAALVLGFASSAAGKTQTETLFNLEEVGDAFEVTPFVIIEKSGKITLMNPKPEMGQGTFQSLPSIIAEELEVSLDKVTIKQTSGEKVFGPQTAGGSASVRGSYMRLRKTGAAAREMLVKAAGQQWNVPVEECYAANASVFHKPSGKSLSYGELVEAASKLEVPQNPVLKKPEDFKILGKSIQRPDIPLKVSGKAVFGIDAVVPGMVYASVERCQVLGSKLVSYDDKEALKIKGVLQVVKAERIMGKNRYEGIAVVADNYWAALQGRKALKVQWDYQGHDSFNSKDYEQGLKGLAKTDGITVHDTGNFDKAFSDAPVKTEAFYETPILAHATMEPMNCTVQWLNDGKNAEVWVSAQGPDSIKNEISKAHGIPADDIKVNILFNGGGFGRRLSSDYAVEAAGIAKAVGKPVKVIWTREDDIQLGPFRPMTFSAMKGALSADGKVLAFQHKVISPSISATQNSRYDTTQADNGMVEGISDQKYEFPNMKNAYVFSAIHVPMAPWRSVTSSTLAFAHECFIDELAVKAKKDPLLFRLELLTKESDTKKVLTKLRAFSNWDKPLPTGWGRGVAQYEFFAGLAANVVEVSKQKNGSVKIEKVYSVIDLGTVVNPDNTKAQVEGAIVMALTAAIKDGIRFENGKSVQTNFQNYKMLRINEMPKVEVLILADGGPIIKGVGEPGLPPLAPALANAIFAATGKRIRRLPFDLNKIV
ncbi:MAG: xanthine dehydrogenase family protein molybdopterin-binding subunit [Sediminibacterium sp.]